MNALDSIRRAVKAAWRRHQERARQHQADELIRVANERFFRQQRGQAPNIGRRWYVALVVVTTCLLVYAYIDDSRIEAANAQTIAQAGK